MRELRVIHIEGGPVLRFLGAANGHIEDSGAGFVDILMILDGSSNKQ